MGWDVRYEVDPEKLKFDNFVWASAHYNREEALQEAEQAFAINLMKAITKVEMRPVTREIP